MNLKNLLNPKQLVIDQLSEVLEKVNRKPDNLFIFLENNETSKPMIVISENGKNEKLELDTQIEGKFLPILKKKFNEQCQSKGFEAILFVADVDLKNNDISITAKNKAGLLITL